MHPLHRHRLIVLCLSLALVFPAIVRAADPGPIQMEVYADQPIGTINPMYLGAHFNVGDPLPQDWEASAQTRLPSHGLTNGALIRNFIDVGGPQVVFRNGKAICQHGMTWWDAIQYPSGVDAWHLLNEDEQLKDQALLVTPGFPNQTKETSAAFVAFCNGNPDDTRPIGVDRLGIDWKTVGYWASIRTRGDAHHPAHPEPYHVKYWELGNELYFPFGTPNYNKAWLGQLPNVDNGHVSWIRADYYVHGRTLDGVHYDGYLDYYAAMKAVDPSIQIGAMLAPEKYWAAPWDYDWNDTLLTDLQSKVDFFSCHPYVHNPHDQGKSPEQILALPILEVESQINTTRSHMSAKGYASDFPLFADEWQAPEAHGTGELQQMVSSLFVAETLGVFLRTGVLGECFFGPYDRNTNDPAAYGQVWASLVSWVNSNAQGNPADPHWAQTHWNRPPGFRWPDYYAFTLWKDFGQTLLQCSAWVDKVKQVDYFAGLNSSGKYYSVLTVNKTGDSRPIKIYFHNASPIDRVEVREVRPRNGQLTDEDVLFNGVDMSLSASEKLNVLEDVPPLLQQPMQGPVFVGKIAPYAITLFRFYLAP